MVRDEVCGPHCLATPGCKPKPNPERRKSCLHKSTPLRLLRAELINPVRVDTSLAGPEGGGRPVLASPIDASPLLMRVFRIEASAKMYNLPTIG